MELEVPDMTNPILACRAFKSSAGEDHAYTNYQANKPRLMSIVQEGWYWKPGTNEGRCSFETQGQLVREYEGGESIYKTLKEDDSGPPGKNIERVTPTPVGPPHKGHGCGLWGLATWEELFNGYARVGYVLGAVEMWGRVIPGTNGWRSQYQRIVGLLIPKGTGRLSNTRKGIQRLADAYGVPILTKLPELTFTMVGETYEEAGK